MSCIKNIFNTTARFVMWLIFYVQYLKDFISFRKKTTSGGRGFSIRWKDRHPCLFDKTIETGFDRHYIFHTAWAVRILAQIRPEVHVDISSSLYFCSMVSAFIPVRFYDYRPATLGLDNLAGERADLLSLPFSDRSVHSISCMHVVEHVGLGRYGEPLGPDSDLKAINELKRVLAAGGNLLFVVPVGKPRIMFNAHRVYSYDQVRSYFEELSIEEFALIPDDPRDGGLIRNATKQMADVQKYGCGCFWFKGEI